MIKNKLMQSWRERILKYIQIKEASNKKLK